jgi:hypothetical protein
MDLKLEPEYPESDPDGYEEFVLGEGQFRRDDANGGELSMPSGGVIFLGVEGDKFIEPKPGDTVRVYPESHLGSRIRGIFVNGKMVRYKTPAQSEYEHHRWVVTWHNERKEKFIANREKMDANFDALPDVFKKRIQGFREKDADFRWDSEDYEVFCCTEAVKIAAALREQARERGIEAVVNEFHKKPWDDQKRIANIDDGHSGNTFGGACSLAAVLLREELGEPVSV